MANIDLFTPRTMLPMVQEATKRNPTWLRDTFFRGRQTFNTPTVEFDVIGREGREMAAFVNPDMPGEAVQRHPYRTKTFKAPELSPLMITTAEDGFIRMPGEELYSNRDPMQRVAAQLGRDLARLDEMITRREEAMCAEAIFTGKIVVKGVGYNETIDFWGDLEEGDKPSTTLTKKWDSEGTTAKDIAQDLRTAALAMYQQGGFEPSMVIVGREVIDVLLNKLSDAAIFDTRRVNLGQIDPTPLPNGVKRWGYLKDSGLELYTYNNWKVGDDGEETAMVPPKGVVLVDPNAEAMIAYGACSCVDTTNGVSIVAGSRVPSSWVQFRNPTGRVLQLKSRPLPIIKQVYGFHVINAMTED